MGLPRRAARCRATVIELRRPGYAFFSAQADQAASQAATAAAASRNGSGACGTPARPWSRRVLPSD